MKVVGAQHFVHDLMVNGHVEGAAPDDRAHRAQFLHERDGIRPHRRVGDQPPLRIEHDGHVLSFISSISTFNTPMDVTVAELAIETLLPADPATSKYLQQQMS